MYGYIYKTTNIINKKMYIGQHKATKFEPSYKGSGYKLINAFKHHGSKNFKVELIDTADSAEELNQKEIYWISKLNTQDEKVGYNICRGGRVNKVYGSRNGSSDPKVRKKISQSVKLYVSTHPEEIRKRARKLSMSLRLKYKNEEARRHMSEVMKKYYAEHPQSFKNRKPLSEETKAKISKSLIKRNRSLKEKYNYIITPEARRKMSLSHKGKKLSNEIKEKISRSLKGRKRSGKALENIIKANQRNNKKVICLNTGKVYSSMKEAGIQNNISLGLVSHICVNNVKNPRCGLVFRYYKEK